MIHRAFKYRLEPTPEQEMALSEWVGVTRFVYNLAWEQRRDWWRQYRSTTGRGFSSASQSREITLLRAEIDWIGAVPSGCLHQAIRDLDQAFVNFFAGRSRFPTPRRRGVNDAFRLQATVIKVRQINGRWHEVRLPTLGWVRFRSTRPIVGEMTSATIRRDALGWHVAFACKIDRDPMLTQDPSVGVDRGIARTLTLSTGEVIALPDMLDLDRRLRRAKRVASRRQRGSKRHGKAVRRAGRISARISRIRGEWQHRASTSISRRFGTVVLEDLKIANLTARGRGKRGINRSILNQGWGGFAQKLAYKLEERGGTLLKVNPAYTSQTCSDCGAIDRASRKSQAEFACTSCGFALNADHNAAIVILRRSTPVMPVEGRGCAPVEAGTCLVAA